MKNIISKLTLFLFCYYLVEKLLFINLKQIPLDLYNFNMGDYEYNNCHILYYIYNVKKIVFLTDLHYLFVKFLR